MQIPAIEHAYLLQALGWALANSVWQTALLWFLYYAITTADKNLPALVKYNLIIIFLCTSFVWFLFTIFQSYFLITNTSPSTDSILLYAWLTNLLSLNQLLPILSIGYLLVLLAHLIKFYKRLLANRFLQTDSLIKTVVDLRLFTAQSALRFGIKKKIGVWLSPHVDVPSVTGFLKPVILLPAAIISHLSIQQVEAVLLHELAHIKRNDYLINILQCLVEQILFFNPFVILLSNNAKKERENCCDDWVINFQYNRYDYAKALLILEEKRGNFPFPQKFAMAATNSKSKLLNRIKRLFSVSPQTDFNSYHIFKLITLGCFLLTLMLNVVPQMNNRQPVAAKQARNYIIQNINLPIFKKSYLEQPSRNLIASKPPKFRVVKKDKSANSLVTQPRQTPEKDYVNAFINEELITPMEHAQAIISQAAEREIPKSTYFVRVEEQESGKRGTNTYYFELNHNDGDLLVKPLIMVNKSPLLIKRKNLKHIDDSLKTEKKLHLKKRITS